MDFNFNMNHNDSNQADPAFPSSSIRTPQGNNLIQLNVPRLFLQSRSIRNQYPRLDNPSLFHRGSVNTFHGGLPEIALASPPSAHVATFTPNQRQIRQMVNTQYSSAPVYQVSPQLMNSHIAFRPLGPVTTVMQPDGNFIIVKRRPGMEVGLGRPPQFQQAQRLRNSDWVTSHMNVASPTMSTSPTLFVPSTNVCESDTHLDLGIPCGSPVKQHSLPTSTSPTEVHLNESPHTNQLHGSTLHTGSLPNKRKQCIKSRDLEFSSSEYSVDITRDSNVVSIKKSDSFSTPEPSPNTNTNTGSNSEPLLNSESDTIELTRNNVSTSEPNHCNVRNAETTPNGVSRSELIHDNVNVRMPEPSCNCNISDNSDPNLPLNSITKSVPKPKRKRVNNPEPKSNDDSKSEAKTKNKRAGKIESNPSIDDKSEPKPKKRRVAKKVAICPKPTPPENQLENESAHVLLERRNREADNNQSPNNDSKDTSITKTVGNSDSCETKDDSVNPIVVTAPANRQNGWDAEYDKAQNAIINAVLEKGEDSIRKGSEFFTTKRQRDRVNRNRIPLHPQTGLIIACREVKHVLEIAAPPNVSVTFDRTRRWPSDVNVNTFDIHVHDGDIYSGYPPIKMQVTNDYPSELPVFLNLKRTASSIANPELKMRFRIAVEIFLRRLLKYDKSSCVVFNMIRMWAVTLRIFALVPMSKLMMTAKSAKNQVLSPNESMALRAFGSWE